MRHDRRDIDERLGARRPAPSREFAERLRGHLLHLHAREHRPARLWLLVAVYAGAGALLLVLAAIAGGGGAL